MNHCDKIIHVVLEKPHPQAPFNVAQTFQHATLKKLGMKLVSEAIRNLKFHNFPGEDSPIGLSQLCQHNFRIISALLE